MALWQRFRVSNVTPYAADPYRIDAGDGTIRVGGCDPIAPGLEPGSMVPCATLEQIPLIPEADWEEGESLRSYERRDLNQNGYPACCLASLCNAIELSMVRDGRPHRALDWLKAWRVLSGGRGGVGLSVALKFAMDKGIPLADGSGVMTIAEAWECDSLAGLASGLQRGCLATFGHDVHAECATRLVRQSGKKGWFLDTRNSWGNDWGDRGWHLFPLDAVELRTYGANIIRELGWTEDLGIYKDIA